MLLPSACPTRVIDQSSPRFATTFPNEKSSLGNKGGALFSREHHLTAAGVRPASVVGRTGPAIVAYPPSPRRPDPTRGTTSAEKGMDA